MDDFLGSNTPDAPTPISSAGQPTQSYRNAAGDFNLHKNLSRKVKSRKDSDQPRFREGPLYTGGDTDDATKRYFGDFSIEAKRHVWDLLDQHPQFGDKGKMRLNRVGNNTREVLKNDPTITQENGGYRITQQQPQASQNKY